MHVFEHLRLHTRVHLKFLGRSRVLLGFGLLIALGSAIGFVPALFLETTMSQFDVLKSVAEYLHGIAVIITAAIGLLVLWSHRRQRSIKMVVTKPSPLEGWVASIFASAALAGLAAHAVVAAATFAVSLYWGVPYKIGFLYVAADRFVESMIVLAFLTALGAACHPIIATLLLFFFNESTFKFLGTIIAAASQSDRPSLVVRLSDKLLVTLYYVAPTFGPFDHKTDAVAQSMRVGVSDWQYLCWGAAYALLACAFGYVATLVLLQRRSLT